MEAAAQGKGLGLPSRWHMWASQSAVRMCLPHRGPGRRVLLQHVRFPRFELVSQAVFLCVFGLSGHMRWGPAPH